jgi:hypothetical protein
MEGEVLGEDVKGEVLEEDIREGTGARGRCQGRDRC